MLTVLYHQNRLLIAQTTAKFDKTPYGGFNLGLHTGDEPMAVLANRAILLNELNALTNGQVKSLHWLNQIHSKEVVKLTTPTLTPQNADAWVGEQEGEGLVIMTADCVPIVLFDDDSRAVACIHAGWQGLVKGIIKQTFQTLPKGQYRAIVGACIGVNNYEVDRALGDRIVADCVAQELTALDKTALSTCVLAPHQYGDKCYLNVGQLTKLQLLALGIEVVGNEQLCSYEGAKVGNLYSHRYATHQKWENTGRMAMVVVRY